MNEGAVININTKFETIYCYKCRIPFAVPAAIRRRWLEDGSSFYCPNGHRQHYCESDTQRLQKELERERRRREFAENGQRAAMDQAESASRRYLRIRERVKNGVCPCCNRTFQNLARHMKTKHPDFGEQSRLKVLREAFGLTLADLGEEVGLSPATVSKFERGDHVSQQTQSILEIWIDEQEQA